MSSTDDAAAAAAAAAATAVPLTRAAKKKMAAASESDMKPKRVGDDDGSDCDDDDSSDRSSDSSDDESNSDSDFICDDEEEVVESEEYECECDDETGDAEDECNDDECNDNECNDEPMTPPVFNTHIFFDENGTNGNNITTFRTPLFILRMPTPQQQSSDDTATTAAAAAGAAARTRKRTFSNLSDSVDARAKNPCFAQYSRDEKTYFQALPIDDQYRIGDTETIIQSKNQVKVPMRFKVLLSQIDDRIKSIAIKKVDYLSNMSPNNGEYYKMTNWIESLCRIPIGKYAGLPIFKRPTGSPPPSIPEISSFLARTQTILDSAVYGHSDSKDQIIRFLAQWIVNPKTKGSVIGIHGPPGVGKTTLVKDGICKALDIPFASIPLGGASDGSFLDGHSYTYEGSTWGRIVSVLMECQCMNPVLYMDEVDKLSGRKSDEVTGILIHLTDPQQNTSFSDKYFSDVPIDLSRSIMVFTYNDPELVSPILRDRMISIEVKPYTDKDKLEIARKHLVPSLNAQFNFADGDVVMSDKMIKGVIDMIQEEAGVRGLRRGLEHIFSNINLERLVPVVGTTTTKYTLPLTVTEDLLRDLAKKMPGKRDGNCTAAMLSMYV